MHLRLRRRDAGVERFELGEELGVLVDQVGDPPQHLGALVVGQTRPDPGLGGLLRAGHRVVDGFGAAVGELGDLLFGGGVDDRDHVTGAGPLTDLVQHILHRHWYSSLSVRLPKFVGYALNQRNVQGAAAVND